MPGGAMDSKVEEMGTELDVDGDTAEDVFSIGEAPIIKGVMEEGDAAGRAGRHVTQLADNGSTNTYFPPAKWNAMSYPQRQAFLQARAAAHISALTSALIPQAQGDDVSAITNVSNVPNQVAQVSQAASQAPQSSQSVATSLSALLTPFTGRAAHGRGGRRRLIASVLTTR
jgi:hypothetical protein